MDYKKLFVYSPTQEIFESNLANEIVDKNAIAYIDDPREIWALGTYFPCPYSKEELDLLFLANEDAFNEAIEALIGGASGDYNTLKKIEDIIKETKQDLAELDSNAVKLVKIEGASSNLNKENGVVTIPKATKTSDGVLTAVDKTFVDGIRDGNLALPTPVITGTWTFYNSADEVVLSSNISPVPNAANPLLEQGYKASFSGTYKWTHEEGKKDPTQVQSGSNWSDLPASGVNSLTYTSAHLTSNTTIKIGILAAKTGLMVSGSNVVPASGMDTTTATRSVSFTTRRYFGVTTEANITETVIKSLNSELGGKSCTKTGVTASTSLYYVYAYPKSLGALSTIIQDGATPVLGAFTRSELNITNAAGASVTLYIYRANNLGAFTNAQLQFS